MDEFATQGKSGRWVIDKGNVLCNALSGFRALQSTYFVVFMWWRGNGSRKLFGFAGAIIGERLIDEPVEFAVGEISL